jgi:hypothetical protein
MGTSVNFGSAIDCPKVLSRVGENSACITIRRLGLLPCARRNRWAGI